ncbi:terpenoid cyclases/protein prenyltransferase alpha-alpha toroid [Hypoxylon cercidicola]|nr:terpenoid cyclases/protein prenyltransferase alpha-alpha toroid [Hypoxylon cercidicola]
MRYEERNTNFNCLAPVNKAFHMVVAVFEDGLLSKRLREHRKHIDIYLWIGRDGSWYGAWAICYTYATFFALQSLENVGSQYGNSNSLRRACHFLFGKQMDDGGSGVHYTSCLEKRYIHHDTSQVVNTAWAALALMHAGYLDPTPVQRGLQLICGRQQSNGEWLQEAVEGVFNRTWCVEHACIVTRPTAYHDN